MVQGYKDFAALGVRINFSDPALAQPREPHRVLHPRPDLPANERYHVRAEYRRHDWSAALPAERRRLLRPLRPHQDQPQGLRLRRGLPRDARLRRAAAARPERGRHLLRRPRALAGLPERAHGLRLDRWPRAPALRYSDLRHSLGQRRRGEGATAGTSSSPAIASRGRSFPKVYSDLDLGLRPSPQALLDLAPQRRRLLRRATATSPSPTSTSAASGTTGWTMATRSGTASGTASRASS